MKRYAAYIEENGIKRLVLQSDDYKSFVKEVNRIDEKRDIWVHDRVAAAGEKGRVEYSKVDAYHGTAFDYRVHDFAPWLEGRLERLAEQALDRLDTLVSHGAAMDRSLAIQRDRYGILYEFNGESRVFWPGK